MKIFILGMPCSGKTTLGRMLASSMTLTFVDLDEQIELESGKSVQTIFHEQGEPAFRKHEARLLRDWCAKEEDFIMATGGGTPCYTDNVQAINQAGLSLVLDVAPKVIAERLLRTDFSSRPLFADTRPEDLKENVEALRSQRIAFYHLAHIRVSPEMSVEEVITVIRMANQR
jgi:shikimate kinase